MKALYVYVIVWGGRSFKRFAFLYALCVFFCVRVFSSASFSPSGLQEGRVPSNITTADYQCRVIVRDVTGKYSWDAAILYGPVVPSASKGEPANC